MEAWSCYRLLCRNGEFIYLKTRGYLEVDSDTNAVRSIVSDQSSSLPPSSRYKLILFSVLRKYFST